jgi:hypothetical protein
MVGWKMLGMAIMRDHAAGGCGRSRLRQDGLAPSPSLRSA